MALQGRHRQDRQRQHDQRAAVDQVLDRLRRDPPDVGQPARGQERLGQECEADHHAQIGISGKIVAVDEGAGDVADIGGLGQPADRLPAGEMDHQPIAGAGRDRRQDHRQQASRPLLVLRQPPGQPEHRRIAHQPHQRVAARRRVQPHPRHRIDHPGRDRLRPQGVRLEPGEARRRHRLQEREPPDRDGRHGRQRHRPHGARPRAGGQQLPRPPEQQCRRRQQRQQRPRPGPVAAQGDRRPDQERAGQRHRPRSRKLPEPFPSAGLPHRARGCLLTRKVERAA